MTEKLVLKNAEEKLILTDTKKFGEAIHAEATERERKQREDRVIGEVQRLIEAKGDYIRKAAFATEAANWYTRKLDAINAGEFTLNLVTGAMTFNDDDLNRANF